jgi:hypothetical protein
MSWLDACCVHAPPGSWLTLLANPLQVSFPGRAQPLLASEHAPKLLNVRPGVLLEELIA